MKTEGGWEVREVGGERERDRESEYSKHCANFEQKQKHFHETPKQDQKSALLIVETLLRFLLCSFSSKSSFNAKKEKT